MAHPPKRECIRSATTMYDLNDAVLKEVFQYLPLRDLSVLADVSTDFKRNAQAEFSSRYDKDHVCSCSIRFPKVNDMNAMDDLGQRFGLSSRDIGENMVIRGFISTLRNFGTLMSSLRVLRIDCAELSQRSIRWINRYCGETLNELFVRQFDFSPDLILETRTLLSRLKTLQLTKVSFDADSKLFSFCTNLEKLIIADEIRSPSNVHWYSHFRSTIPTLQSLSILSHNNINDESLSNFLKVNPQLRELNITSCGNISSKIIQSIVKYTPHIEKFQLSMNIIEIDHDAGSEFVEDAMHLKHLTALKSLNISCRCDESFSRVIAELAAARIPLKDLRLSSFVWNTELVTGIAEMKQLQRLSLNEKGATISNIHTIMRNLSELTHLELPLNAVIVAELVKIIRRLPKLNQLEFHSTWGQRIKIDEDHYMRMLNAIRKREHKFPLKIIAYDGLNQITVDVPKKVLKANEESLKLCIRLHSLFQSF